MRKNVAYPSNQLSAINFISQLNKKVQKLQKFTACSIFIDIYKKCYKKVNCNLVCLKQYDTEVNIMWVFLERRNRRIRT